MALMTRQSLGQVGGDGRHAAPPVQKRAVHATAQLRHRGKAGRQSPQIRLCADPIVAQRTGDVYTRNLSIRWTECADLVVYNVEWFRVYIYTEGL